MADQPDARGVRPAADGLDPGEGVGDVILDGRRIGVARGGFAAIHAPLVDAHRGDPLGGEPFGHEPVYGGLEAGRAVAVAVDRAGAGQDQRDRAVRRIAGQRPRERPVRAGGLDGARRRRDQSGGDGEDGGQAHALRLIAPALARAWCAR